MADNRKLMAGILNLPESARKDLAQRAQDVEREGVVGMLRKASGEMYNNPIVNTAIGFTPGVGDVQAAGETIAALQRGAPWQETAGYAVGMLPFVPALRTTWHGSPHGFERFDMSKIGTGEGAQAYGHGLYLAESPGTARSYQESLSTGPERFFVNGEEVLRREAKGPMLDVSDPKTAAIVYGAREGDKGARKYFKTQGSWGEKAIAELDALKGQKITNELPGYLYKVDLPDEQIAKMLDWDKPLSEQPKNVQEALTKYDPDMYHVEGGDYDPTELGQSIYQRFSAEGAKKAREMVREGQYIHNTSGFGASHASNALNEIGIPGIQYLDQASRGAGEGTRNYVVFSDEIPKILERNGTPLGNAVRNFEAPKNKFDITTQDASDIFGEGASRIRYQEPNSQGFIDVLQRPDGTASVLGLEVPETARGKGIGQSLQQQVLSDFPEMQGQVSSKAAATTAHRLGRRPVGNPEATLDDVFKMIDEDSSVNLVSPEMQKRFNFGGQ